MMTARDQLDILTTYQELGSYRATATLCGTTHKTVRRVVERRSKPATERPSRPRNTDIVRELIAAKVKRTDGRISVSGATTATLSTQYDSITLVATSTEWSII